MGISFKPEGVFALHLTPQGLEAGLYRWPRAELTPVWVREVPLDQSPFTDVPTVGADDALQQAVDALWREAGRPYVTVQVSVDDTLGHLALYDFDELPTRGRDLDALVRLRLTQELDLDPQRLQLRVHPLEPIAERPRLLVAAMDRQPLARVRKALGALHLPVTWLDLHGCYRLAYAGAAALAGPAAWLQVSPASWSLLVLDASQQPVYLKSRPCPGGVDLPALAGELKRILLSLSLGTSQLDCTRLYHNLPPEQDASALFTGGNEEMACICLDGPAVRYAAVPRDESLPI